MVDEDDDQFHTGVVNFEIRIKNKRRTYTHELQSSCQHRDPCRGRSSGPPPTMPGDPASPCLHLLIDKSHAERSNQTSCSRYITTTHHLKNDQKTLASGETAPSGGETRKGFKVQA